MLAPEGLWGPKASYLPFGLDTAKICAYALLFTFSPSLSGAGLFLFYSLSPHLPAPARAQVVPRSVLDTRGSKGSAYDRTHIS
jgi:hypothetical protein